MNVEIPLEKDLSLIRKSNPLVLHLVNHVVMNDCANVTLALHASPMMTSYEDEIREIVSKSNVIYINIGTPTRRMIGVIKDACEAANEYKRPIILDPVGVGATKARTSIIQDLLKNYKIDVLKGNYGEICSIAGISNVVKGVDSLKIDEDIVLKSCKEVAKEYGICVVATGKKDFVVDKNENAYLVLNGHEMLSMLTGSGCMLGSVIACFLATQKPLIACLEGLIVFNVCAEIAAKHANGVGSFKVKLLDELSKVDAEQIKRLAKLKSASFKNLARIELC